MTRVRFFVVLLVVSCFVLSGCGGKKAVAPKDYGKPTWLKPDPTKFGKLSEDETNLEGGTVTVFDPEGWERMPPGTAKPPQGFKTVIVFKKNDVTLMMTKSKTAREMPDLDEENVEEFAESAQQLFKAPVKMLKLGNIVGVMFAKQVADKNRLSKKLNCRIFATCINGQLFTYELISDDAIADSLLNALFAVISKTKIEGGDVASKEPVVATAPEPEPTKPEPVKSAEPVVAVTPKPEPKPESKPEPAKPAAVKDKKNTKAILDELDALLN